MANTGEFCQDSANKLLPAKALERFFAPRPKRQLSAREIPERMKTTLRSSSARGFTLIELLTVIAIIGILAAILIPTVGRVRETARRTADASAIRQIAQACLIYANEYNGRMPGTVQTALDGEGEVDVAAGASKQNVTIYQFAAALARSGGLNDATLWVSNSDEAALADNDNTTLTTVLQNLAPNSPFAGSFAAATLSFQVVSGLTTNRPSTTPVACTRGLTGSGTWAASAATPAGGVYGTDGGHIAYLGGNVNFYTNLTGAAQLAGLNGLATPDIKKTLLDSEAIIGNDGAPYLGTGTGNVP